MTWDQDNKWESGWWGDCTNTLREELLQFVYANRLRLNVFKDDRTEYNISAPGQSIIDFGGGPVSLLLKVKYASVKTVVEPCSFPYWVGLRYGAAGINYLPIKAEEYDGGPEKQYTEAWIYNVLQHVEDPEKVIRVAQATARKIRIFEWVDAGVSAGHPHELTQSKLDSWLGIDAAEFRAVEDINEHGAIGKCYYGVFRT